MEYSISISEILAAVLFLLASGLGYIIREQKEKIKAIKSQLSEKKYHLYHEIYSSFFDLIIGEKSNKKHNEKTLMVKVVNMKKDLLIYAPDEILNKYIQWNSAISNNEGDPENGRIFLELFILMRKDMGHPKSNINETDILRLIMTSEDEVRKMKEHIKL